MIEGDKERIRKLILRNKSLKNRKSVSKAMKGRIFSEEHKHNIKLSQNTPEMKELKSIRTKGKNNPQWKGDKVSYRAIHMWMQNNYGKADVCEGKDCKRITQYYEWANISGKYKRNIKDWIKLCKSCHMLMDNKKRRLNV